MSETGEDGFKIPEKDQPVYTFRTHKVTPVARTVVGKKYMPDENGVYFFKKRELYAEGIVSSDFSIRSQATGIVDKFLKFDGKEIY